MMLSDFIRDHARISRRITIFDVGPDGTVAGYYSDTKGMGSGFDAKDEHDYIESGRYLKKYGSFNLIVLEKAVQHLSREARPDVSFLPPPRYHTVFGGITLTFSPNHIKHTRFEYIYPGAGRHWGQKREFAHTTIDP